MGTLMFGWDEQIECIQPVQIQGSDGEALCLAYKTSKLFIGAGVYLRDDGYVLRDATKSKSYYPWPDAAKVKQWQTTGKLPDPLPAYSIPFFEYAFGYSLWVIIAGIVAWTLIQRARTRRRHARDAATPVSLGPPQLLTDADRFLAQTARAVLREGEQLQHQAFALRSAEEIAHCYYVALTSERVLLFDAKRGAFKPVLETTGMVEIPRSAVAGATESAYTVTLRLAGREIELLVPQSQKHFSNQVVFVRDVPRILSAGKA